MNIVFLSSLFPDNLKKEIETNSKGVIQNASNTLQWNFLNGLDENINYPIKVINAPIIGSFPLLYKKVFVKKSIITHNTNAIGISISYCNLPVIKNYFIRNSLINELNREVKKHPNETNLIIVYGMLAPWVLSATLIKKRYSNVKLCLIVPDLPEYISNSRNIIYRMREYFIPNLYKYIPIFDYFVLLTAEMANHLKIKNKPWITIEGMINPDEINIKNDYKKINKKIIMYSGTLAERYGILDLLSAFESITDASYELWICGDGNTREFIKAKAKKDNRIKYFGQLPREQVLELQRKSTVLVNPRNSEGEYTKYSFPSKTMEYLLSGTPSIMYSLPGIPEEYKKFIFLVDNKKKLLKDKIIEVCEMDELKLKSFGQTAQSFVLNKKNYKVQTKKMTEMFSR